MIVRFRPTCVPFVAVLLSALLAGSASAQSGGAEPLVLRLQPPPGAEYVLTYDARQDMTMAMGVMGENEMTSEQLMTASQEILGVAADGTVSMRQTPNRIKTRSSMGEATLVAFDSASNEEPPAEMAPLAAMLGKPITITLTDRGAIESLEGFEEIWASAAGDDPMTQAFTEQLELMFGEEAMRQQMQLYSMLFPEEGLTVGDSWSQDIDVSNPLFGELIFTTDYAYEGRAERDGIDCANFAVAFEGDLDFDMSSLAAMLGAGNEAPDIEMDVSGMGGTGDLCVEVGTGLTRRSHVEIRMTMEISVDAGEDAMEMRMDLDQTIAMSVDPAAAPH